MTTYQCMKPREIQLYAGDKPQTIYEIYFTDSYSEYLQIVYTNRITQLEDEIKELKKDKLFIRYKQLESDKTNLTNELNKNLNEIHTILTKWKAKDLVELSAGIRNTVDKGNELEKQVKDKENTISQRNKTIQNLELKNEKSSESYKKLIQHLADARLLVSHLQKDLAVEKQDKQHIQNELNDALTILNKPTREMETQTDLTAEQITQMEKDIKTKKNELAQLKEEQEEEIDKKVQEITVLQTKYDMETKTKEKLLEYLSVYRKQNILQYIDNVSKENKVGIEEFLNQHLGFFTKVNYLIFKLTSDRVIDFNWIKKIASDFSLCLEISYSRMISAERPAPKIILNNLPKHFKKVDKLPHEWIDYKQTKEIKYEPEVVINYKE